VKLKNDGTEGFVVVCEGGEWRRRWWRRRGELGTGMVGVCSFGR